MYHPAMQTNVALLAEAAGAELCRGQEVMSVMLGEQAGVAVRRQKEVQWIRARVVIGADGRSSRIRGCGAFDVRRELPCLVIAGTIHYGLDLPEDTIQVIGNTQLGRSVLICRIGAGQFRTYLVHRHSERLRGA
jgi:2-polyprenyl-6-methoxyphenol hydroxylase-like FAD-dependent oxidoreductase